MVTASLSVLQPENHPSRGLPYPKLVTCDRPVGLNNLKKAKRQSEAVNRSTDNTMAKRKKGQKEQKWEAKYYTQK